MAKRISVDRWLFVATLVLVFIGLVMVFSASAVMAKERYHSGYFFLLRQLGWAVGGFIAMLIGMRLDYKKLKQPAAPNVPHMRPSRLAPGACAASSSTATPARSASAETVSRSHG